MRFSRCWRPLLLGWVVVGGLSVGIPTARAQTPDASASETFWHTAETKKLIWSGTTAREALTAYQSLLALPPATVDAGRRVAALREAGNLTFRLGQTEAARRFLEESIALGDAHQLPEGMIAARSDLCTQYLSSGQRKTAQTLCETALNAARQPGITLGWQAYAHWQNSNFLYSWDNPEALRLALEAVRLWREAKDNAGIAEGLLQVGYLTTTLDDLPQAEDVLKEALTLWRVLKDKRGEAVTLLALGGTQTRTGDKQMALNYFLASLKMFPDDIDFLDKARLLNGFHSVYAELRDEKQASAYISQSLVLFRQAGHRPGEIATLYGLGAFQRKTGQLDDARRTLRQVLNFPKEMYEPVYAAAAWQELGAIEATSQHHTTALKYYEQARQIYLTLNARRPLSELLVLQGRSAAALGQPQQAHQCYQDALKNSRAFRDRFGEESALYELAVWSRQHGDLVAAQNYIARAIDLVEYLRSQLAADTLRITYLAAVYQRYEFYIAVLMQRHAQDPAAGHAVAAWQIAEQAHARAFQETLRGIKLPLTNPEARAASAEIQHKQREINDKTGQLIGLVGQDAPATQTAPLESEIDQLTRDCDQLRERIRRAEPRFAALTQLQPLDVAELQQTLDDQTLLLEYALGEEKSYLWVISRQNVISYPLPPRQVIEDVARTNYNLLIEYACHQDEDEAACQTRRATLTAPYNTSAQQLSNMLLKPAASLLAEKRLLFVTDGILSYLPFAALPHPSDAAQPLLVHHEIAYQPSAATLVLLHSNPPVSLAKPRVAIFADAVFEADDDRLPLHRPAAGQEPGSRPPSEPRAANPPLRQAENWYLPRLLGTQDEVEVVAASGADVSQSQGFAATREAALDPVLSNYGIIHFATHGLINTRNPELSGLVLSRFDATGKPQDGVLRLTDIYQMRLPADLVVLSACQSALGKEVKGEGLLSLTRGFMQAGARSVAASLWSVRDDATAELMKHFYHGLLAKKMSAPAALRYAQLTLREQKGWSAPYYWAAFTLQGEFRPPAPTPSGGKFWLWGGISGGLLLLLAGWYFIKSKKNRGRLNDLKPVAHRQAKFQAN